MQPVPISGPYHASHSSAVLPRWKRTVDVACCIAVLPLLGLLTFYFGIIAVVVAKGPVFFRQENVGLKGRKLRLYRFRTMRGKSFAPGEPVRRDERALIPGGRFLRSSGLVELPQIVNVLRGEMSIVGPRPVTLDEDVDRESQLAALPGLTGPWRVSCRNVSTTSESVPWDVAYAGSKSLWVDSKIILRTLPVFCLNATGIRKSRFAVTHPRRNAAAEAASLRTPSRQPW